MTMDERVLAELQVIKDRLDRLEKFADRAEGAITFGKWVLSFLGMSGVGLLLAVFAQQAQR